MINKIIKVLKEETAGYHFSLQAARFFLSFFPSYTFVRLRMAIYRAAGFKIKKGSIFMGNVNFTGFGPIESRLVVGENCVFNIGILINLGAEVTIGDNVAIGHEVLIMTDSHLIGSSENRAAEFISKPVRIGSGAWIGARAIIQPGVTIGAGAVVAAGAVVSHDIPPNSFAGGVPAKVIRELEK
ncbi:MAG: acyltransferase [Chloroflexi bacterium]|nr:acyltransferase [Chloroflexota bacterium]